MPTLVSPVFEIFREYNRILPQRQQRPPPVRRPEERRQLQNENKRLVNEVRELQEEAYFRNRAIGRYVQKLQQDVISIQECMQDEESLSQEENSVEVEDIV